MAASGGPRRWRAARAMCCAALALAMAAAAWSEPAAATADPGSGVLVVHPHEGTPGTVPTAAGEGYAALRGNAVDYSATAISGASSIAFTASAATYFDDVGLVSTTGQLVWSAPIRLSALPAPGTADKFVVIRSGTKPLAALEVGPTGQVRIKNGANALVAASSYRLSSQTWYTVELSYQAGSATVRMFTGDAGTLLATTGPVRVTSGAANGFRTGLRSGSTPLFIDQVTIAQSWVTPLPPPPPPPPPPCGGLADRYDPLALPIYQHVVVIMEENLSYANWQATTQAPYSHALAADCASETSYHGATHPSQPNYMAVTSGFATGVGVETGNENIFDELQAAGLTWRNYAESMSTPCQARSNGAYKPGHTPAFWYTDLRQPVNTCVTNDVPMTPALDDDIAADTLPTFAWISPNQCNDFHYVSGCTYPSTKRIAAGDAWLKTMIGRLTAMPSYLDGDTLILVTFDEGDEGGGNGIDCTDPVNATRPDCQMPTIVISPYIVPGETDSTPQSHYSLGGTIADILGVPRLGREIDAPSLRGALTF